MKYLNTLLALFAILLFTGTAFAGDISNNVGAKSDASQGQSQGQTSMNVNAPSQSTYVDNKPTFVQSFVSKGSPTHHIPADITFPGMVGNLTSGNDKGPNFTSMYDLLKYKSVEVGGPATFTREELENIAEDAENWLGNDPGLEARYYGGQKREAVDEITVLFSPTIIAKTKDGRVNVFVGKKLPGMKVAGQIHSSAWDEDIVSLDVLAVALIDAMNNGCNAADVTTEDVVDVLKVGSWGLGFNMSAASATMDSGHSAISSAGGGGTGVSENEAYHAKKPYLQMAVGVK
ncbi:hypothetical protein C0583_06670 [Candidatus Parcubacteria bacterium]|nr:MAG: hypothetical protein C0583_06670 [Candidatus Parcubacteria bacterium]